MLCKRAPNICSSQVPRLSSLHPGGPASLNALEGMIGNLSPECRRADSSLSWAVQICRTYKGRSWDFPSWQAYGAPCRLGCSVLERGQTADFECSYSRLLPTLLTFQTNFTPFPWLPISNPNSRESEVDEPYTDFCQTTFSLLTSPQLTFQQWLRDLYKLLNRADTSCQTKYL